MDKSFHHTSEFEKLDDFQAFVSEQIGPWAELDKLVENFVEKKIVIEKYRSTAIQRFSLAVSTSAMTARSIYLSEQARSRAIVGLRENIKALRKVREGISQLVTVAIVPGYEDNELKYGRAMDAIIKDIKGTKEALEKAIEAARPISQLPVRNFKNTDLYKHVLVQNLSVCWEKFTGWKPTSSSSGRFAKFVRASFPIVGITDGSDAGRYIKDVFGFKKNS
jgi:hypothetical protein